MKIDMRDVAKWAWVVLIGAFAFGWWILLAPALGLIVGLLLWWLKPEWLEKF